MNVATQRIISAAILLPVVIAILWYGGWPLIALAFLTAILAGIEYVQMLRRRGYRLSLAIVLAMAFVWLADAFWGDGHFLAFATALVVLSAAAWQVFHFRKEEAPAATWALNVAGGLYLGVGGAYLIRLRLLPGGAWLILTALPVVWIADSFAYWIGRRWGRHKMAPALSPKKSWEGYAAEVISGLLFGAFFGWMWPRLGGVASGLTPMRGLLLGGILAALTPLGDFFVSLIKREVGVKDSGKLIPGHGGAFDRVDSLLWAGFIAWALATLWLGIS